PSIASRFRTRIGLESRGSRCSADTAAARSSCVLDGPQMISLSSVRRSEQRATSFRRCSFLAILDFLAISLPRARETRHGDAPWNASRLPTEYRCAPSDLLSVAANLGHNRLDAVAVDDLDALGTDPQLDAAPLRRQEIRLGLNVGIPPPAGAPMRMRNGVVEVRVGR